MFPPELRELTLCLYSSNWRNASEELVKLEEADSVALERRCALLDEERLAQLVAPDK